MIGNLLTALGWVVRYLVPVGTLALATIIFLLVRMLYEDLRELWSDVAAIRATVKKIESSKKVVSSKRTNQVNKNEQ